MGDYSVEVKPVARKELEALPDSVLARVLRKMEALRRGLSVSRALDTDATCTSDDGWDAVVPDLHQIGDGAGIGDDQEHQTPRRLKPSSSFSKSCSV